MNTRNIAGFSLAAMGIGFIVTLFLPDSLITTLLQGGFEAGLVGGIADWFAVTALFRHPFGIPIPHTSLLLKNRGKIVNSLISAMETELLNKDSITHKLSQLNLMTIISSAVTKVVLKRKARKRILAFLQSLLKQLPLERFAPVIQSYLTSYVRNKELKPLAQSAVASAIRDGWDEKALDRALEMGTDWAVKRETEQLLGRIAYGKLNELQVGGFMGFAVQAFIGFMNEEKLGGILQGMLVSGMRELRQPGNPYREQLLYELKDQADRLANNDDILSKLKGWLEKKAESPETEAFLLERLQDIRDAAVAKLEEDERNGGRYVLSAYRFVVEKIRSIPGMTDKWEEGLRTFLVDLVEKNHFRIGVLVRDNLNKLDDQSLVQMLEQKIGGDLQWIRVNGALCGFLVGLVLSLFHL
ncbi:DUF445 domain-containing protein [Paenibacillus sp. MBLB4367]|uniref:DUF445 domain-containing protein n=1 Tax=Paenibacillus sp. MBLB4367 TaxID=3384767 RepID=UPI0039081E2E